MAPHPRLLASTCNSNWAFQSEWKNITSGPVIAFMLSSLETLFLFLLPTEMIHPSWGGFAIKSLKYPQSPRKRLTGEMFIAVGKDKIASTSLLIGVQPSWLMQCPSNSIYFPCEECALSRFELHANFNQTLKQQWIMCKGCLVCHCPLNYVIHINNKPLVQIIGKYRFKVCWNVLGAVFNPKGRLILDLTVK